MANQSITQKRLKELLHYDPDTGVFTWTENAYYRVRGKPAGTKNTIGYIQIQINRKIYHGHRLAFLYMEGNFPPGHVDHIDHDPHNTKFVNLRKVTHAENMRNQTLNRKNTSGHCGVHKHPYSNKWFAKIVVNQKQIHGGFFDSIECAIEARKTLERAHGFHKLHGSK